MGTAGFRLFLPFLGLSDPCLLIIRRSRNNIVLASFMLLDDMFVEGRREDIQNAWERKKVRILLKSAHKIVIFEYI